MNDEPTQDGPEPYPPERLAELLGGAAGDLDETETRELDRLLADPSIRHEAEGHRAVTGRLGAAPDLVWREARLSGDAVDRVRDRIRQERRRTEERPSRRRPLLAAAAACLVLGVWSVAPWASRSVATIPAGQRW